MPQRIGFGFLRSNPENRYENEKYYVEKDFPDTVPLKLGLANLKNELWRSVKEIDCEETEKTDLINLEARVISLQSNIEMSESTLENQKRELEIKEKLLKERKAESKKSE